MLQLLKRVFSRKPKVNYKELVKNGAIILDVRTQSEYQAGHIKNSMHISIDQLDKSLDKLSNKSRVIITCCGTGMRSKAAASLLKASGYSNVYDAGSWTGLKEAITP
jgi:phage shock protein E